MYVCIYVYEYIYMIIALVLFLLYPPYLPYCPSHRCVSCRSISEACLEECVPLCMMLLECCKQLLGLDAFIDFDWLCPSGLMTEDKF